MDRQLLAAANAARASRKAHVIVTHMESGESRLHVEGHAVNEDGWLADAVATALRTGRSTMVGEGASEYFLAVNLPPPRLIVIGAVHISQALVPLARLVGFDMTVIDPRTAFATAERFGDVSLHADWPDAVLPVIGIDPHSALAALTHDPKIDDPALMAALSADCFYVGALGSRRTHAKRRERLLAAGVTAERFDRIKAPIGLDIGAANPQEIALAVMAEVVAALRQRDLTG